MAIDFSITSAVTSIGRTVYNAQRINSTETKFNIGGIIRITTVMDTIKKLTDLGKF